jgi:PPM family protein phosphatase
MRIQVGVRTDVGRARERNEDSFLVQEPLFVVADGMGGHRGGNVASSLAVEALAEMELPQDGAPAALVEGIRRANLQVLERGEADRELRGMGTTMTTILAIDQKAHVAHVGDSRLYLLRAGGDLQQLTEDHTLVQRMVREGKLSPEEAEHHPQRSVITRALGVESDVDVDELTLDVHPGDRLLLCTDGLNGMLSRDRIEELLRGAPDPQAAADRLVEEANRAGGEDNITVIVLEMVADDEPVAHEGGTAPIVGLAEASVVGQASSESTSGERDERATAAMPATRPTPPPRRHRGRRLALWTAGLVVVIVAALVGVRLYVDRQWYVGESDGAVAIYKGIPSTVLGVHLSHVEESTDLDAAAAEQLQPWRGLAGGITAKSLQDARSIVEQIRSDVAPPPVAPSPSPSPTPSSSGSPP